MYQRLEIRFKIPGVHAVTFGVAGVALRIPKGSGSYQLPGTETPDFGDDGFSIHDNFATLMASIHCLSGSSCLSITATIVKGSISPK